MPDVEHPAALPQLEQIRSEFTAPDIAGGTMLRALFLQFFVKMLRNYSRGGKEGVSSKEVPLTKAYILIEDSFLYEYASITLESLSARLGLSTRQTRRILYRRYGQTFTEKKTQARMAAAAVYLREDGLSAAEIAEKLGYSSVNHFYAAFKQYYHMTMKEYRSRLSEQAPAAQR